MANLIRAWRHALNSYPATRENWVLAIAGWEQAGYGRELKRLNSDYGLAASVRFLGPLFGQEKDATYRACDVLILPSLSEGLPMAVLEAWPRIGEQMRSVYEWVLAGGSTPEAIRYEK